MTEKPRTHMFRKRPGFSHLIRQQHDGQDHLHRVQNALEHQAIADLFAPFAATNDAQNVEYQASGEEYQREGKEKVDFHGWLLSYKNAGTSS